MRKLAKITKDNPYGITETAEQEKIVSIMRRRLSHIDFRGGLEGTYIPNKMIAALAKRLGMEKNWCDLYFSYDNINGNDINSFWVELKVRGVEKASTDQRKLHEKLKRRGEKVLVLNTAQQVLIALAEHGAISMREAQQIIDGENLNY